MKHLLLLLTFALFLCHSPSTSFSAEEAKKASGETGDISAARAKAFSPKANAAINKTNFGITMGKIIKIDSTNPANIKMEVKNDADNTTHTIDIMPWTSVTKVTDISELKAGDNVRVMTRKTDNKETAMGVMFGKIRNIPKPAPVKPLTKDTPQTLKK